jgi:hypothetical protein
MSAIDTAKDIYELAKKGATIELQERLIELREQCLTLQEENLRLRERLRDVGSSPALAVNFPTGCRLNG